MTTRQIVRTTDQVLQAAFNMDPMLVPDDTDLYYEADYFPIQSYQDVVINGHVLKHGYPRDAGVTGQFIKNGKFRSTGSLHGNPDLNQKIVGAKIRGHGRVSASSNDMTGGMVGIHGDDWTLEGLTFPKWQGGQLFLVGGDRWKMAGLKGYGGVPLTGEGGLRVLGGYDWNVRHCDIECGDDVYQTVPAGNDNMSVVPMSNLPIGRGTFEYCTGRSFKARLMAVALMKATQEDLVNPVNMTASVTDIVFRDIRGQGGIMAMVVLNYNSTGVIDGIEIIGGFTDMSHSTAAVLAQDVLVKNREGVDTAGNPFAAGGIRNVRSVGHKVLNPRSQDLVRYYGAGTDLTTIDLDTLAEVA